MEPQLFIAGGGFAFYSLNLNFLYGFWPESDVCDVYPTRPITTSATCTVGGYT